MFQFYNEDCITGAQKHLASDSVDLIITDPPYGIQGDKLDKHYNRNENFVLDGYVEIPEEEYADFSHKWIQEAERVLKPGGSIYIVSGYSNLIHILNALSKTQLEERKSYYMEIQFWSFIHAKNMSHHITIFCFIQNLGKNILSTLTPDFLIVKRPKLADHPITMTAKTYGLLTVNTNPARSKIKMNCPQNCLPK